MWNGVFTPSLTKRIGIIRLTPLDQFTNEDFDWLDWDNLRNIAKNRLALKIIAGLVAFIEVILEEPEPVEDGPEDEGEEESSRFTVAALGGRAKRRYIYGATEEDEESFDDDDHDFFRYESDEDATNQAVEDIENLRDELAAIGRQDIVWALSKLDMDERARRAVEGSDSLSDANFYLLVAIVVALDAIKRNVSFTDAATDLLNQIESYYAIAAGRGI